MRISRPCYDKPHRCPGRAGGGWKWAKVTRCEGGFLNTDLYEKKFYKLRFNRCNKCDVLVLPYAIRYIDPYNWYVEIKLLPRTISYKWDDLKDWWKYRV